MQICSLGTSATAMAQAEQMIQALVRQSRRLEQSMAGAGATAKIEPGQQQRSKLAVEEDVPPSIEEFMALNKASVDPIPAFPATDCVDFSNLYSDAEDDEDDIWEDHENSLEEGSSERPGIELHMKPFQFASGSETEDEDEVEVMKAEDVTGSKASAAELQKTARAAVIQKLNAAIAMEALEDYDSEVSEEEGYDAYLVESDEEGEMSSFSIEDDG